MTKISRTSTVAGKRVQNSYVNRVRYVEKSDGVQAVTPVDAIKNQTGYYSSNYTLASDFFYKKLEELKREYKEFYHDHRRLEEAIENIDEESDHLLEHMKELIEKYNKALHSLKKLDEVMSTNNAIKVIDVVDSFKAALGHIGILVDESYTMVLDADVFIDKITNSLDPLNFLFQPMEGLVIKLYRAFKSVKYMAPKGIQKSYGDGIDRGLAGMLLDEES
ncbi:acyl-ACP--UDP-N-acetylglucosamine O-acyltransferase [Natronincola ferrireducens]|uniref:Uncharacterized protein n=1 Tax=Natronincola ferrireducens TaxID=393762 RepID=A0A1G8X0S5_9FIRM|nr:acyl-ACP--UDP-N-acetylglucosamine O-acyltransferase [Natronincola ferrireducens]SDJ84061.1 hypothetical protein SAMN05660472_00083 [Natronincola ferrireducens]